MSAGGSGGAARVATFGKCDTHVEGEARVGLAGAGEDGPELPVAWNV
jgi:hypothetical protein